jgi:hypothetical protein
MNLACDWNQVRPEFKGVMRRSEVTGAMEPFYPEWRRGVKYIVSAAATLIMCAVAFHVMIASLNLQVGGTKELTKNRKHEKYYVYIENKNYI